MACVVVPAVEAIVTTVITAVMKDDTKKTSGENHAACETDAPVRTSFKKKMKWLNVMLWGGCALLVLEHVWHGEIVPWFPFLTGAASPAATAEMLKEMATNGVAMSLLVTAVWGVMVGVSNMLEKRAIREYSASKELS